MSSVSVFDYRAPAELYASASKTGKRPMRYTRFKNAAEAIKYAVEVLPPELLLGIVDEDAAAPAIDTAAAPATDPAPASATEPAIVVPAAAVRRDDRSAKDSVVFVVENGKAARRAVRIGRERDTRVEIVDGLRPGDLLIAEQSIEIAEGVKIAGREAGRVSQ